MIAYRLINPEEETWQSPFWSLVPQDVLAR
jgi:hypothetical protein